MCYKLLNFIGKTGCEVPSESEEQGQPLYLSRVAHRNYLWYLNKVMSRDVQGRIQEVNAVVPGGRCIDSSYIPSLESKPTQTEELVHICLHGTRLPVHKHYMKRVEYPDRRI